MNTYIDWSKSTKSKDYRGSGSFSTLLIVGRAYFPFFCVVCLRARPRCF